MIRSSDDWFWLALGCVAVAVIWIAGKNLFSPKRDRRWLPIFAGLSLVLPTACASKPRPHLIAHPSCGTGWDDCAWQEVLAKA